MMDDIKEANKILKRHQKWWRDNDEKSVDNPMIVDKAIDMITEFVDKSLNEDDGWTEK